MPSGFRFADGSSRHGSSNTTFMPLDASRIWRTDCPDLASFHIPRSMSYPIPHVYPGIPGADATTQYDGSPPTAHSYIPRMSWPYLVCLKYLVRPSGTTGCPVPGITQYPSDRLDAALSTASATAESLLDML